MHYIYIYIVHRAETIARKIKSGLTLFIFLALFLSRGLSWPLVKYRLSNITIIKQTGKKKTKIILLEKVIMIEICNFNIIKMVRLNSFPVSSHNYRKQQLRMRTGTINNFGPKF